MCPIPPTTFFNDIAVNETVPEDIRAIAAKHLEEAKLQKAVNGAHLTVAPPSSGADDFHCKIYSMNNKAYPKFIADQMNENREADEPKHTEDEIRNMMKEGKLNASAVLELPGDLVQNGSEVYPTKIFHPNADGTYPLDTVRQTCYDNFHTVWKFYKDCFGRNSIDGNGLEIRATIHISRGYANAYWAGDQKAMFFGDGGRFDGRGWLFAPEDAELQTLDFSDPTFVKKLKEDQALKQKVDDKMTRAIQQSSWESTLSLDIIGHELTHGVVQHTAALGAAQAEAKNGPAYLEAGTLNEHIADCFGTMIKHWSKSQTAAEGGWDMAEGFWSKTAMELSVKTALGYMKRPWTESYMRTFKIPANVASQPDSGAKHLSDMDSFTSDPHANCGVPNHAFYLAALEFYKWDKKPTWDNIGKVWYNALTDPAFRKMEAQTFKGWRDLTTQHAEKLFGSSGRTIMDNAWTAVGL